MRDHREVRTSRWYGGALGLIAGSSALATAELTTGILHQRASPLVAVAEQVIQLTPGPIVETSISLVGSYDKPILVAACLIGLFAVSALAGMLAIRRLAWGQAVFFGFGLLAAWSVKESLTASPSAYLPAVLGAVAGLAVLTVLVPRARAAAESPAQDTDLQGRSQPNEARRRFLVVGTTVVATALVTGGLGRFLAQGRQAVEAARRSLKLPVRSMPTPAGTQLEVDGVASWVTRQKDFYRIDTALVVPQILPEDWRLRVHGMVDRELELTYDQLQERGLMQAWVTLCCVSNEVGGGLISNASWSGVRIADILAEAGVQDGADAVRSTSEDGWTCGTPLPALTDDRNAMLAVAMNGEPLTVEHGFPVRMVVPGLYGYVSATKWVVDLEVTRFDAFTAFWTDRGWSEQGPVKTQSRIDVPRAGADLAAGEVVLGGVAWAQHTGIAEVEVSVDGGPWQQATLGRDPSIDSWVQWKVSWQAKSGSHDISVRATDRSGYTQTSREVDPVPDGATGWHTIAVEVSA